MSLASRFQIDQLVELFRDEIISIEVRRNDDGVICRLLRADGQTFEGLSADAEWPDIPPEKKDWERKVRNVHAMRAAVESAFRARLENIVGQLDGWASRRGEETARALERRLGPR
jgi:hypothetical protein